MNPTEAFLLARHNRSQVMLPLIWLPWTARNVAALPRGAEQVNEEVK